MSTAHSHQPRKETPQALPGAGACLLLVLAYLLLAEFGHALSFESKVATFWPPSGLSLAALLLSPKRGWPRILVAILAANLFSDTFLHEKTLWQSLGFATANLVEALLGAYLFKIWFPKRTTLSSFGEVAAFVLLCCTLATEVGATIGAGVLHYAFELDYWESWRVWWSGDAIGMLVFAPLFLQLLSPNARRPRDWQEYAVLASFVVLIGGVTQLVVGQQDKPIATLIVPLLIVVALRFKMFGAVLGVATMTIVAIWDTSHGQGLFASLGHLGEQAFALQIYVATMSVSALTLAAAATEREYQAQLLENHRKEISTILDTLPAYIWFKDTNNRMLKVNQAAAEATGLPRDQIEGKTAAEIYPDQADSYYEGDRRVMASGQSVTGLIEQLQGQEGLRWMSIDKHPVKNTNDEIEGIIVVATDITEQREAERQLRLNQFTTDHSTSAVYWARPDGSFAYANQAACEMLGYSREELLSKCVSDIAPLVPRERWLAHWQRIKEEGAAFLETKHLGADGLTRDVAVHINYFDFEDEEFLVATARDITERRIAERQLRLNQFTTDQSPNAIYWVRSDGHFVYVNDAACLMLGYPRGELLGKHVSFIDRDYPPERWPEWWDEMRRVGFKEIETRHHSADGQTYDVSVQINYIENEEQSLLVATTRDISERKQHEQEMARIREQLQLAMTGGNVGLWDWDIVGENVFYSPEFHDQLGEPHESLSGLEDWKSRLHPDDIQPALRRVEEQFEGHYADSEYEQTFRMRHADGSYRWIRSLGQLLRDSQGNPLRMIGVHVDVTENHELLEKLTRAYRELDNFTYIASHDLKAPLRAIDNLSRWMAADLEDQIPEKSAEHLAILQQRAQRMELLLSDLLEYSRVGRSQFQAECVDTGQIVKEAFELVAPTEGFRLSTSGMPIFNTVRPPLELCFRNLIDNAIKHHDRNEGCITVECEVQTHYYRFSVSDDGAGIPEEFHERIFGMFQSLKPRDEVEGSGIGLAMLKKTVEHYGGQLTLESEPGSGCTFFFTWPKTINKSNGQIQQEASVPG